MKDDAGVSWSQRLADAVAYLETGLRSQVDMAEAARRANCSLCHFVRMFGVVFGLSPGEYVRRRRLGMAALDLGLRRDRVIDVAMRYGYETPEAFAKAFRRQYGITPSQAREDGTGLEIWPPLQLTVVLKGDRPMQYRIETREALEVSGYKIRTTQREGKNTVEITAFWQRCLSDGSVDTLASFQGGLGLLGLCAECNPDGYFHYYIAVETPDDSAKKKGLAKLPGVSRLTVPPATYVVFPCVGPMPTAIQETWKRAYNEWFPASGYEFAGTADFEVYPPFPRDDPRGDPSSPQCYTEVWIPVKPARR